jgi:PKHD-type hydroxylase
MTENLRPYFDYWSWKNLFLKKEIVDLNNFIENNFDHYESNDQGAKTVEGILKKNTVVKCIYYKKIKHFLKNLEEMIISCNRNNFGYDIFKLKEMDEALLNIYSSDNLGKYDYHCDIHPKIYTDVKLTILINLSLEQYEGGKFMIFNQDEYEVKELNEPGSVVVFKSYLNHKVTPVTKGERRSLTLFITGPCFK